MNLISKAIFLLIILYFILSINILVMFNRSLEEEDLWNTEIV